MERRFKVYSVINHLLIVYVFFRYLVDDDLLPDNILKKNIRMKPPEVLPRAVP